jgi:hypothetical protein
MQSGQHTSTWNITGNIAIKDRGENGVMSFAHQLLMRIRLGLVGHLQNDRYLRLHIHEIREVLSSGSTSSVNEEAAPLFELLDLIL